MVKDPILSIIIAHYRTSGPCENALKNTLKSIDLQNGSIPFEIIIGDDGSPGNSEIFVNTAADQDADSDAICSVSPLNAELISSYGFSGTVPDRWCYYRKTVPFMGKARILNHCVRKSRGKYLLFLDDDNLLLRDDSLVRLMDLFNSGYDLVFGQVIDGNGRARTYESRRVQGTTFALTRKLFDAVGGFGVWTEEVGCAVDSDIWWKLFQVHSFKPYKAVYTEKLQTRDSCSGRWKKHLKGIFRNLRVRREFRRRYSVNDYKSTRYNLSRRKDLWLEKD